MNNDVTTLTVRMECERLGIDLVGLSEIRWIGNSCESVNGYRLYYSGGDTHHHGVGFLLSPQTSRCVLNVTPINDRLISLRIDEKSKPITCIQVYMPTCYMLLTTTR